MNSRDAGVIQGSIAYNECLITQCLKKLIDCRPKSKAQPGFTITDSIAAISADLTLLNIHNVKELSAAYLQAMEASMPGAAFRYVIVHENNSPVLFTYFNLLTITSKNFNLHKNKTFVKGIFNFFFDLKKIRVLISGNVLRNETLSYCYNTSVLSASDAAEIIASAAEKIAADERISAIILKDIPDTTRVHKLLASAGYDTPIEDKVMVLEVNPQWTSLADYTAAITRKYKARANKILVLRSNFTTEALSEERLARCQPQINKLFKNVADNQAFIFTPISKDHFAQLKSVYKEDFEVYGYFMNGKMVAFYTAFITKDAYELYYLGLDYDVNDTSQLYFNILFSGLERAIELGRKQLKLGRTSFDAKASLGAKPVDMPYFIKTSAIPKVVNKWFANYFTTMEDAKWKLRNPLK